MVAYIQGVGEWSRTIYFFFRVKTLLVIVFHTWDLKIETEAKPLEITFNVQTVLISGYGVRIWIFYDRLW